MLADVKRYRLRSMPSAHCVVEIQTVDNKVTLIKLQSYRMDVIMIDLEYREITCTGTYSQATPNQYKFLNGEDYDKAVHTAWSYLNNDTPLTYRSYQKYCEQCDKATAYSYYW